MPLWLVRSTLVALLAAQPGALLMAHPTEGWDCVTPVRPVDDQNDVAWQRFLDEIDRFRACATRHMEGHQAAAAAHHAAAREAVAAWDGFVKHNLNAPEDFPWPPADAQ